MTVKKDLNTAIKLFVEKGEESHGIIVVGIPIGSTDYVDQHLAEFTNTLSEDTAKISHAITSDQTLSQIYSSCLVADVAANTNLDTDYSMAEWSSLTTDAITVTTKGFLCCIMQTQQIPFHAYAIVTLPE
eukprot:2624551-Ditylum_brightwellii.AAC.1